MINNAAFADRLRKIMEYYQISASAFADRIQVPRSSISHLLSGRNKPSLDFVLKVVKEFDEVELYWLLNGKGRFPSSGSPSPSDQVEKTSRKNIREPLAHSIVKSVDQNVNKAKIERIVIFYDNGTFKEYNP